MRLTDVRRLAIQDSVRVRFAVAQGLECVVDHHGIARVPTLASTPDFNLESALESAQEFTLESVPLPSAGKTRSAPGVTRLDRAGFEQLCQRKAQPAHAAAAHDQDE